MTEEVSEVVAEVPAPEQVETASPAPEVDTPEEKPVAAPKTFTQEELDAAIGKRLAREQRKWERMQAQKAAASPPPAAADAPSLDQFETPEAYADALATHKAHQLLQQQEAQRQQAQFLESYHEKEEEARNKYDDFEQVAYNPTLPITTVMAQTIQASEVGPDVAYYLGTNPKEADRISRLSPFLQAKEIGRIEAQVANNPVVKRTTSAPAPITPVTARASGSPSYDTTDPRSTKTMSASEWIEAERRRQIKKLQAQMTR
jgi:hypothetical protein